MNNGKKSLTFSIKYQIDLAHFHQTLFILLKYLIIIENKNHSRIQFSFFLRRLSIYHQNIFLHD
jgi:hypothetical protein